MGQFSSVQYLPKYNHPSSVYKVGSTIGRVHNSCQLQAFFPIDDEYEPPTSTSFSYWRDEAVNHITTLRDNIPSFAFFPLRRLHPVNHDTSSSHILKKVDANGGDKTKKQKWPVIIFTHGLFGTMEMYTSLCSTLASQGYVVLALEHEDGSAIYSKTVENEVIRMRFPTKEDNGGNEFEYTRQNITRFREPFLDKRCLEMKNVLDAIKDSHMLEGFTSSLNDVFREIDLDNLVICGHSFGGAAVIHACDSLQEAGYKIKGRIVLDIWSMPVNEKYLEQKSTIPSLFLFCPKFVASPEFQYTQKIMSVTTTTFNYEIKDISHQQFSDTPYFLWHALTSRLNLSGSLDPELAHQSIHETITTFLEVLDSKGAPLGSSLASMLSVTDIEAIDAKILENQYVLSLR